MIEEFLCKETRSLLEAFRFMNLNRKDIVFVVDETNILKGVITDGDIRRWILQGGDFQDEVQKLLPKMSAMAQLDEPLSEVLKRIPPKVNIVPVVDSSGKVVNYHEIEKNEFLPVASPDLNSLEFNYLTDAFLSGWISSNGQYIKDFEAQFSLYMGASNGVAVSSGTTALHLALLALDIGPGDEVIVPDLTFASTANVVIHAGATPVIVDIEESSWNICPKAFEAAITPRTKAIIPVHLYGQPCQMDQILSIAKKHKLKIVEDCAEAHGAEFQGKKVGTLGDIGCFSFFANKIMTTGEGGMCITDDPSLAAKMKLLRDHGMSPDRKYFHEAIGYNYRMTNLQAAIGCAQLKRLDEILQQRELVEELYREESHTKHLQFQKNDFPDRKKVTWLVTALWLDCDTGIDRDSFLEKMKKEQIDCRPFFIPLSEMPIYKKYVHSCSVSQRIAPQGFCFPTFNDLNEEKVQWLKKKISSVVMAFLPK